MGIRNLPSYAHMDVNAGSTPASGALPAGSSRRGLRESSHCGGRVLTSRATQSGSGGKPRHLGGGMSIARKCILFDCGTTNVA